MGLPMSPLVINDGFEDILKLILPRTSLVFTLDELDTGLLCAAQLPDEVDCSTGGLYMGGLALSKRAWANFAIQPGYKFGDLSLRGPALCH